MTIRRRPRGTASRRPLIEAAIGLLELDAFRAWMAAPVAPKFDGQPPPRPVPTDLLSVAHRAAIERTLTRAELEVVDLVLAGEVGADFLDHELGGSAPDRDEELEALTVILGREPRLGG